MVGISVWISVRKNLIGFSNVIMAMAVEIRVLGVRAVIEKRSTQTRCLGIPILVRFT